MEKRPGVSEDNILTVSSKPRNRRVMEILEKTGEVERSGQGFEEIDHRSNQKNQNFIFS